MPKPLSVQWPTFVLPTPGQLWSMTASTDLPGEGTGDAGAYEIATRNPYPFPIFLRKICIWNGAAKYSALDLWSRVWACGGIYDPPQVIWSHNWDRYAPTSWHAPFEQSFGDGYIEIVPGGWLTFHVQATGIYLPEESKEISTWAAQFLVFFEAVRPGTSRFADTAQAEAAVVQAEARATQAEAATSVLTGTMEEIAELAKP